MINKRYRDLLRIVIFTFILHIVGGCSSINENNQPPLETGSTLVLGFAQLGAESSWRTSNTKSITEAAQNSDIKLMYEEAEQKQENQIKAIRSFIAYQVDVIAFAPIVENGWDNVLSEAKAAGIPVILTDRYIDTSDKNLYACYIGSDFEKEGQMAAEFLKKKFKYRQADINIVELFGTLGSSPAVGRSKGFTDALADSPKFKIIASKSGDFMRSKGKEVMADILNRYENINVVYSHNDSMTLGALEAIEDAGLRPGKDIVILSIDGEQDAIDALKQGKINCVVECNPMLGDTIIDTVKRIKNGESVPKAIYTSDNIFTEWDDLKNLPPRGY